MLGPEPWRERADWSVRELPGLGVLSHCPTLPVRLTHDRDGAVWALLGLALQTDPSRSSPADEIAAARTSEVPQLGHNWAGRWLLLGNGRVWPDAGGLLGCYYAPSTDAKASAWASSSSALLARVVPAVGNPRTHTLGHERGVDWFPPPGSRYPGMRRLLPSQALRLRDGKAEARAWLPDNTGNGSYAATLDSLEQRLVAPLKRLPLRPSATVWIPLTAGFDSRLVLAAALRADLPVRAYTNYRRRLSLADVELPGMLARAVGVPHEWHRPGHTRPEAEAAFDQHSAGDTVGVDRGYWSRGQWDFVREGDSVLRGGCFEVGRRYYHRRLPMSPGSTPAPADEIARSLREPPGTPITPALAQWVEATTRTSVPRLDWRDRFYLEQRLGGWLAALEQALDLVPGERVHIANAAATYALMLELPDDVRGRGQHQRDLVARLAPPLAEFPFNPPEEAFGRLSRLGYRLRSDPGALLRSMLGRLGA